MTYIHGNPEVALSAALEHTTHLHIHSKCISLWGIVGGTHFNHKPAILLHKDMLLLVNLQRSVKTAGLSSNRGSVGIRLQTASAMLPVPQQGVCDGIKTVLRVSCHHNQATDRSNPARQP